MSMLLGTEVVVPSRDTKVVRCLVGAATAGLMLMAVTSSLNNSNQAASGPVALWGVGALRSMNTNGVGSTLPRQGALRANPLGMYGIQASPMANLALTAIDANDRSNRMRDVSMQAQAEVVSGWSTVDDKTRQKLSSVLGDVKAKASLLAGITAPMGFFDPIGFSTTVTGGKLLFYREVELKHGRVAMLAALGFLVGEQFHPLFGGDIDVPSVVAFQQTPLENFWPAVVAAIAIPEVFSVLKFQDPSKGEQWAMREDHEPGDLGFDPLGLKPSDPQEFKAMQTKELNNGRLAMIAAAGMVAQELATGEKLF